MSDHTFFVSGRAYLRTYGSTDAFEWPGLIDTVGLAIQETVIQLPDRTQSGGGIYKEVRRIASMTLTLNHREIDKATLARAVFGESANTATGTITDEEQTIKLGHFVPLLHPGPYTDVSITDDSTSPVTIAVANYEVRSAGIWINADAADLSDDDIIKVTYTHPGYDRVQALIGSPVEYEIFFEGINEARSDVAVPARFHKVRFGPAAALDLLSGDDFGALSLAGEVLKDTTKSGATTSKYFYADIVIPAS